MQEDHRNWLGAHAQWRQDIERWQLEHESAVARLAEMQEVVRRHGECLAEHARSFRQAEEAMAAHDREIAQTLANDTDTSQEPTLKRHQEQEGVFSQQCDAHERIKLHHETVMARLKALESAAASAM